MTEIPLVEPSGEGEHLLIWLEKRHLNTAYVAEQLARFFNVHLRAVSYAGRKDKHALTRQYFSVHLAAKPVPDVNEFSLPGAEILRAERHNRKLRTGALRGNRFTIRLTDVAGDDVTSRLQKIATEGVPNYFGEQRFGNQGSNLTLGLRMCQGEVIRNRNKRSMAISALRAYLFNEYVSARLADPKLSSPIAGDVMRLSGSNSFFVADEINDEINQRLHRRDIQVTGPMFGSTASPAKHQALRLEKDICDQHSAILDGLSSINMDHDRRSVHLYPDNLTWECDRDTLTLSFDLPPGCFATSVIRELVNYHTEEQTNETVTE